MTNNSQKLGYNQAKNDGVFAVRTDGHLLNSRFFLIQQMDQYISILMHIYVNLSMYTVLLLWPELHRSEKE